MEQESLGIAAEPTAGGGGAGLSRRDDGARPRAPVTPRRLEGSRQAAEAGRGGCGRARWGASPGVLGQDQL